MPLHIQANLRISKKARPKNPCLQWPLLPIPSVELCARQTYLRFILPKQPQRPAMIPIILIPTHQHLSPMLATDLVVTGRVSFGSLWEVALECAFQCSALVSSLGSSFVSSFCRSPSPFVCLALCSLSFRLTRSQAQVKKKLRPSCARQSDQSEL